MESEFTQTIREGVEYSDITSCEDQELIVFPYLDLKDRIKLNFIYKYKIRDNKCVIEHKRLLEELLKNINNEYQYVGGFYFSYECRETATKVVSGVESNKRFISFSFKNPKEDCEWFPTSEMQGTFYLEEIF